MNKLDVSTPSTTLRSKVDLDMPVQRLDSEGYCRLIVMVPPNSDSTAFTRKICSLAMETNSAIELLGLYKDTAEELALRRELAMMSALIRHAKILVEIVIERGTNWVEAVKQRYRPGDSIVCKAEQFIGIRRRPLSQILKSNLEAPVYILSEAHTEKSKSNIISPIVAWLGLLAIIAGFFLVQARITQLTNGGFQTLLLLFVLIPEIWLIKVWNSFFF